MHIFQRIGTDKHKYKVQIYLKTLSCNTKKLKGDVYIKIKRGDHKLTSENKVSLQDDGTCDFGKQILTFQSLTMFYDRDKKAYQQKQGELTVIIITKSGDKKLLGSFDFDVAEWANLGKQNIKLKKQFGDKIKVILQFDVFIKCMGQASQTSKSIDKPIQRKKESSLSKFTSFFTGGSKQSPQGKQRKQKSPLSNSKIVSKNKNLKQKDKQRQRQRQDPSPKKISKQVEKAFKNKYDKSKKYDANNSNQNEQQSYEKQTRSYNISKKNQNTGSQRKITEKPKKKKIDSQQSNEEDENQKNPKNLVNIKKKKDNYTQIQESQADLKGQLKNKNSKPAQEQIYFDEPNNFKKQNSNTNEQLKTNKMKRTQNSGYTKQSNQTKQKQKYQKQTSNKKINDQKDSQAQNAKQIKDLKDKTSKLQKQNLQLKDQNNKLLKLNKELNEQMNKRNQQIDIYRTERQGTYFNKDDQRVRNLQKQKGDLLIKVQKLQQKYKKDFQKYEQRVQQYEEQKTELQQASKAEIKRLKQQFSELKDKYDKVMIKYEEKANQFKQFKQKQNDLKERLAIAQNNLSELKLKIGDKLNQANQQGNKTVIDILTLLSE